MLEMDPTDVLYYVDRAVDAMVEIVLSLGDEVANEKPALPGANSPFVILNHCVGLMEFWGGEKIAGRTVVRDRAAEFTATGSVEELATRAAEQKERFAADLERLDSLATPQGPAKPEDAELPLGRTQGGVVLHVVEEVFQHLGHMEITRDLLLAVMGQTQ